MPCGRFRFNFLAFPPPITTLWTTNAFIIAAAVSNTIRRQARLPSDRSLRGARADVPLGGVARALHCRQFSKRAERGQ